MPADRDIERLRTEIVAIARRGGGAIMPYFRGDYAMRHKSDHSPVTDADHAAEAIIKPALEALLPDAPVVAEESVSQAPLAERLARGRFWLVDPLDGTKEFVAGRDEFTVNIALVDDGRPILGVIYAPARNIVYAAGPSGATRAAGTEAPRPIGARPEPSGGIVVAHSRSHAKRDDLDRFLAPYRVAERIIAGSAIKFGWIAEGSVDLYPRLGPTMEWDTAAGQAIVEAAGGRVTDHDGRPLAYGKAGFKNPPFIVRGAAAAR